MNKNIFQSAKVVMLALVLSIGISYVSAWTAPTQQPPQGNTSAPLNVSANAQVKSGNLGASWLYAYSYRDAGDPTDTYFMKPSGDSVLNNIYANKICFGPDDCRTSWPAAGGYVAPFPTATIVANGTNFADNVDPLVPRTWTWNSTGGYLFTHSAVSTGCINSAQNGPIDPWTPWTDIGGSGTAASGSNTDTPGAERSGCTVVVTYKATNPATGDAATAYAKIAFTPRATILINGLPYSSNVDPLVPRTWTWNSYGADTFTHSAVSTGCTDPAQNGIIDPWTPWLGTGGNGTAASGSNTNTPGATRAGCTVKVAYTATRTASGKTVTANATVVFK